MEFVESRPDVVRSVNQRWLLNYWNRIRAGSILPTWQGLETEELMRMSESLSFSDVLAANGNIRYLIRFHGQKIAETYGSNCRGKFLDEILPPALRDAALATYRHVVATRRPVYTVADTSDRAGRLVHYERLLLPFGRDGATVDRILISLETVSPEGTFDNRGLMRQPTLQPVFTLYASIDHG
jgi:hypothetical protein